MTGLFNNPNYLGTWMNLVWPFCLALIMNSTNKVNDRLASYFFILSISTSIILTNSRAAWIGLIIGTSLMVRKKAYKYILGTIEPNISGLFAIYIVYTLMFFYILLVVF